MSLDDPEHVVRFVLAGVSHELARSQVDAQLAGVRPRAVGTHAVQINGTWYPVRQAFEVASGIPATLFNSHTARRHLASLGYEIRGEIQHRDGPPSPTRQSPPPHPTPGTAPAVGDEAWHTEVRVQAAVVRSLEAKDWRIVSQADTATKERGIDVVASRGRQLIGIEVKGYPTTTYADPRRWAETKPTHPSNQAGHWYSHALLAAMRLRTAHPDWQSVIALPDFNRYRTLFVETRSSLDAAGIHVWWVHPSGLVEGF